ncbi:MAG: hypothetical protein IPO09_11610 [Anaeromyxobacter sp.]|nr:hypothetical protein [Anaeromyxobacter sp.]MBL0276902.1 hypothetical protein [Anaeromyxobacter sp.]
MALTDTAESEATKPKFVVVMRGTTFARIRPGEQIVVAGIPTVEGPVTCVVRTHFVDEGFDAAVPRGIFVEVSGPAATAQKAMGAFPNAAMFLKSLLSVAANASVGDLEIELALDVTPGRMEHEFVQRFLPAPTGLPVPGRWLDLDATMAFLQTFGHNPDLARLSRAAVHYDLALRAWRPEQKSMALSHLFVGMEALTPVVRRRLKLEMAVDEEGLAKEWAIPKKSLDAEIRRRVLFKGDDVTYQDAKEASDAYEHSYKGFSEVYVVAGRAVVDTARYLREAILELSGTPEASRLVLVAQPFERPFEALPLTRSFHGVLQGAVESLAPPNELYPHIRWSSRIKSLRRAAAGHYEVMPEDQMSFAMGDGVTLVPSRIEVRGPTMDGLPAAEEGGNRVSAELTLTPLVPTAVAPTRVTRAWRMVSNLFRRSRPDAG